MSEYHGDEDLIEFDAYQMEQAQDNYVTYLYDNLEIMRERLECEIPCEFDIATLKMLMNSTDEKVRNWINGLCVKIADDAIADLDGAEMQELIEYGVVSR